MSQENLFHWVGTGMFSSPNIQSKFLVTEFLLSSLQPDSAFEQEIIYLERERERKKKKP